MSDNITTKPAADISTKSGSAGLEPTGGVAGALEKEREARGATTGEADSAKGSDAHAQDNALDGEHGSGTGVAN